MLRYALGFFIVSLIAAFFGFSGVASNAAGIAKIIFYGFIALTGISVVAGLVTGRKALHS